MVGGSWDRSDLGRGHPHSRSFVVLLFLARAVRDVHLAFPPTRPSTQVSSGFLGVFRHERDHSADLCAQIADIETPVLRIFWVSGAARV